MIRLEDIPENRIIFYDIETTSVYAPYCKLKMLAYQIGIEGIPKLVDLDSKEERRNFARLVGDPKIMKVSYNGINFDDLVLWRHGMWVNPINRFDMYLALKTVHPTFPSYSLKAVNLILDMGQSLEDAWHEPEYQLNEWLIRGTLGKKFMYTAPADILEKYCKHDVTQTRNVFRILWEIIQDPRHWEVYTHLELAMGEPLHEMIWLGREYLDLKQIEAETSKLESKKEGWVREAARRTEGRVPNIASNKQLTAFLHEEFKLEFAVSEAGNYLLRKSDKLQIIEDTQVDPNTLKLKDWLVYASYQVYDITKVLGYFRSYLRAGEFEQRRNGTNHKGKISGIHSNDVTNGIVSERDSNKGNREASNGQIAIPKAYGLSAARTRRFRSSSKYKINFQNQNKRSKVIQLVPSGWLGFWLDSTQIENVAHIWASKDIVREQAYRDDENWNEYVWLCNEILHTDYNKDTLEGQVSRVNPAWSIYKQYKTIKLALNFGMGADKFASTVGIGKESARKLFEEVHRACPAIRKLQKIVKDTIIQEGFIKDPFGHIYSGDVNDAYKVVAYLIQGCGTGSIPKAMTVANYTTLHKDDSPKPKYKPYIYHPFKKLYSYGVLTGTTHDESAGRISLGLPDDRIIQLLKDLLFNMEERFSPLFNDIPLRAKLYVSIKNASEVIEVKHHDKKQFEKELITVIKLGKERYDEERLAYSTSP